MERITRRRRLLQTVVSLINLGGRKAGLAPGTEGERDLEQVRTAIEARPRAAAAARARPGGRQELGPVRDALSQLQMAYVQLSGGGRRNRRSPATSRRHEPGTGPAKSSGRLWMPGQ